MYYDSEEDISKTDYYEQKYTKIESTIFPLLINDSNNNYFQKIKLL